MLEVKGNLECPDINGQDVDDFVYTDEDDLQVVLGRVQFEKDLVVKHLVMDNETLNGVDDVNVRMPFEVIVKEDITTQTFMNHSLERDFYRTKATRPSLPM